MSARTRFTQALTLCGAFAAILAIVAGTGDPVRAQGALPGNVTYDRTVAPLDVGVRDLVHVKIELDYDSVRASRGVDAFLVVDRTPTMFGSSAGNTTFMAATKEALTAFVNSLDFGKGEVGMITYAANATVARNLTNDQDALLNSIRTIRMSEENDVRGLLDAFRTATQKLDNDGTPGNEKIIFIVVAGPDQQQALVNMPTVTQAARNAGVKVVFLMFSGATYTHYVAAASDCTWGRCITWTGLGQRYAWEVNAAGANDIRTVLRDLSEHFLFSPSLAQIRVRDGFDPASVSLLPDTVNPLPSRSIGPPYYEIEWQIDNPTRGPFVAEYDVRTEWPDDTYPVSTVSYLYLVTSDGQTIGPIDLPNPPLTVRGPGTPGTPGTPASPTAETPSPTTPSVTPDKPTSTSTAETETPTPQDTATGAPPEERTIFLPTTLRRSS